VRETEWGPLRFEFLVGADGRFEVAGTPVTQSKGEVYRRSGRYRLEGDRLVTPALNEGRQVQVRLWQGQLHLKIDDGLGFRLRRK